MKVKLVKDYDGFKPVVVNLVIETADEFTTLRDMLSYDCTVPEAIGYLDGTGPHIRLRKMMNLIRDTLDEAK